jgi:stage II sporulation protein D
VRILYTKSPAHLDASGPFLYQQRKGGKIYPGKAAIRVRAMRSYMVFNHQSFKGDVAVVPIGSTDTLRLNGRRYRGALIFHPVGGGRYDVVEILGLEEYLYGVLPREVGGDWPLESLKAQAVVSRTYVIANRATDPAQRFDVFSDVKHQVYGGLEDEVPAASLAVDQTRGQILQDHEGRPVQTFFHSSCGGYTETPENVWNMTEPSDVFASIKDDFCHEDPYSHWQIELKKSTIIARLRKIGYKMRDIQKITAGKKSKSGRAVTVWIYSSKGKTEIQGNRFRLALGPEVLRSTLLTDVTSSKRTVRFEGSGWGHGVGLCQWGARGRALAGQKYEMILEAYYPGARLKRFQGTPR